jgi:chromosome segregation ATPase
MDSSHDDYADINSLLAENAELKTQLEQYKMLAQGSERRILDLHTDCVKKDEEIARLKEQLRR